MQEVNSQEELDKISRKIELSLTFRLLGVNQGIRLDKVRSKIEEIFSSNEVGAVENSPKILPVISDLTLTGNVTIPSIQEKGVIGDDGYEWINFPPNSQTNFYRAPGEKEWILWEN